MKRVSRLVIPFAALLLLATLPSPAATCVGADPCLACRDCSQCRYCNSGKGSCGVLRNLTPEQQRKRLKKQAKA